MLYLPGSCAAARMFFKINELPVVPGLGAGI